MSPRAALRLKYSIDLKPSRSRPAFRAHIVGAASRAYRIARFDVVGCGLHHSLDYSPSNYARSHSSKVGLSD